MREDFKSGFYRQTGVFHKVKEIIIKPEDPIDRENAINWKYLYEVE